MKNYLLIEKLDVLNAGAMSSSITTGFPAMSAWLGAVHALERRLKESGFSKVGLSGAAISCHECEVQLYRENQNHRYSIIGTANPLRKKGTAFERPPFIEEPRCHLKVSLLIEIQGVGGEEEENFLEAVRSILYRMKIAGGDVTNTGKITIEYVDEDEVKDTARIKRKLMPGFAVIDRHDLLRPTKDDRGDSLDVLLDRIAVHSQAVEKNSTDDKKIEWTSKRRQSGWIVPLAVGFRDISGSCRVKNQRSYEYEHHFAEPVVTLVEFKLPCHFKEIDEMMWRYDEESVKRGLYLCRNENPWNNIEGGNENGEEK